jgi:hypothetical protein
LVIGMRAWNTSTAVMAQRKEPHDSLDYFPTPPWATRALCNNILPMFTNQQSATCWEPACGDGHMARPLAETFRDVYASDVHDYGFGQVHDFLMPGAPLHRPDWIVTNPPFRLAAQFIVRSLEVAVQGVAVLVRSAFLEGIERHKTLFKPHPPAMMAQFTERVPMVKGRLDKKAATATAYCWLVWRKGWSGPTEMTWISPCRKSLERPEDWA